MTEASRSISPATVDAMDEFLLELGDPRWMVMHDVITGEARLVGMFEAEGEAREAWQSLCAGYEGLLQLGEPTYRELGDRDWRDSYKAHFKPWSFGRLHWVPVWERANYAVPPGEVVIWLDPGLAFGTGNHETTRLCCERLVALAEKMPSSTQVIDAGCGSGILALSAVRLGFREVVGFDNDAEAVRVSEENASLNDLTGRVDFFVGDLISGLKGRRAGIVLANIQADVLMRFARELLETVEPGGSLVLSGILARELETVRATFAALATDWDIESRVLGEWSDLLLAKPV